MNTEIQTIKDAVAKEFGGLDWNSLWQELTFPGRVNKRDFGTEELVNRCITLAIEQERERIEKALPQTLTELADNPQQRFSELERKGFNWRSFYNGWLEGKNDLLNKFRSIINE